MVSLNFVRGGRLVAGILLVAAFAPFVSAAEPLPLTNHKSGISVSLSGSNGVDWAVEMTYHDEEVADQILYVKSSVNFSLAHNANNTLEIDSASKLPHVLGTTVPNGAPNAAKSVTRLTATSRPTPTAARAVRCRPSPWLMRRRSTSTR